jgi:radical SAM enzyme (TIGR01210 family)
MNKATGEPVTDLWILSSRGKKNSVDPRRPYSWQVEKELTRNGIVEDVAVVFLTNRECPYHCLMCDLWKNTTNETLPEGIIPEQIVLALRSLPEVKHIKLYNSGSFFDTRAIPEKDYERIAFLLKDFESVIVESHPSFIGKKILKFKEMLKPELEVALGLETVNPVVLKSLNKKMTAERFHHAAGYLSANGIHTRTFILLKPPFMTEAEGVTWAQRSIDFAFDCGAECCVIIPVRPGNGAIDQLMDEGLFSPPRLQSLEKVVEYGINLDRGRVFADLWDLKLFADCDICFDRRYARLTEMNLGQKAVSPVRCSCTLLQ